MSEVQPPCVYKVFKDAVTGVGDGIDTKELSFVGNSVFCDRQKCTGSYEILNTRLHGACNEQGEDSTKEELVIVDREIDPNGVRHSDEPELNLAQIGLVAVKSEIVTQPGGQIPLFVGTKTGHIVKVSAKSPQELLKNREVSVVDTVLFGADDLAI